MEQMYKGEYIVMPSMFTQAQQEILWRGCKGSSPDAWPELAYEAKDQLNCLPEVRGAPKV